MKPKAEKRILGVLAAVLVLIVSQLPFAPSSSGALSISDPPGDDGPGRDITQAYWAIGGADYVFRLNLLGPFSNNSYYGFYFDTNSGGGSFSGSGLTLSGIDMVVSEFSQNDGNFRPGDNFFEPHITEYFLEWKVAPSNFPTSGLFTWYGATSNMTGHLKDITGPVVTPIPNAAWLLGSGVVALLVLKRRRPKT